MGNLKERFDAKYTVVDSGCWMFEGYMYAGGYKRMWVNGKNVLAHRLSYELHIGPIPEGMKVCHECDTPACVNPKCLFLGTTADNMKDKTDKGRAKGAHKGSAHHNSKTSESSVRQIRELHAQGMRNKDLVSEFRLSPATVCDIVARRTWSHLS